MPVATTIVGLVAAVALTGNPIMRGSTPWSPIDVLLGIALLRVAAVGVPPETPVRHGSRRAASLLALLFLVMTGSWVANVTQEFDVLSSAFRADLVGHLRTIGQLADQADPLFGLRRVLDLYEACLIGALVARFIAAEAAAVDLFAAGLGLALVLAVALGLAQGLTGWAVAPFAQQLPDGSWQAVRRVSGTAADANGFAAWLLMCAPIGLGWVGRRRWPGGGLARGLWLSGLIGAWICVVVMTGSRAAMPAVAVQGLWATRRSRSWNGILRAALVAGVFLACAFLMVRWLPADATRSHPTADRFVGLLRGEGKATALVTGRIALWRAAVDAWAEKPILGVGLGNLYRRMPEVCASLRSPSAAPLRNAHNQLLQIGSESGLIGLAVFGYMAIGAFVRLARTRGNDATGWPERAFATGLVGEAVMAAVGHPLVVVEHLGALMAVMGYALGTETTHRNEPGRARATRLGAWASLRMTTALSSVGVIIGSIARNVAVPPVVAVHGAYPVEWEPSGVPFRWLGSGARVVMDGSRARSLRLELSAAEPDLAQRPVRVESTIEGEAIVAKLLEDGTPRELTVNAPPSAMRGIQIAISCDHSFRPCDVWSTSDCRELCVRLWRAEAR